MGSRLIGRGTPHDITLEADADLSARQFTFVKFTAAPSSGAPAARIGAASTGDRGWILQDDPKAGKGGRVRLEGTSALKVDGTTAIAVGDPLKSDSGGLGVKAATAGNQYNAIALEASSASGDVIEVLVAHGHIPA
jgi:Uncharacterized conserved protein (DUF2190)